MKILIQTVIQVGGTSVFPCFVALQILLTITVSVIQKCIGEEAISRIIQAQNISSAIISFSQNLQVF